jgi:hypothetical protein
MKIRYYKDINKGRWVGFLLAILSAFILSSANVSTQWVGWLIACSSCSIWVFYGYKDKDYARMLMELFYLILAMRAVYNWLI